MLDRTCQGKRIDSAVGTEEVWTEDKPYLKMEYWREHGRRVLRQAA